MFFCGGLAGWAQVSLATTVDLALRNSPKVKIAMADVAKAHAVVSQSKDVYIPNLSAGSGLGYSYGFPLGQPTLFNITTQSLAFDESQFNYIRAAKAGLEASTLALKQARQEVVEDAVLTYMALDRDLKQHQAMQEEYGYASKLATIVQERLDAGYDSDTELTKSKLTAAQVHLKQLHLENDISGQREHLSRLTGLPAETFVTDAASIPPPPSPPSLQTTGDAMTPGVQAAYANAKSKQEQAKGDSRQQYRPQVIFAAQYARFASFNNYTEYYKMEFFQYDNAVIGIQMTWPVFDRVRRARAQASAADATHAMQEANQLRDQATEGELKLQHSMDELATNEEVATLARQLAQQQLDAVLVQVNSGSGNENRPALTPKDEQNAHIAERQKYLDLLDADYQLQQARVNLLRSTGGLEDWVRSGVPSVSMKP